jgi:rhodanese-related sulfurtransferase
MPRQEPGEPYYRINAKEAWKLLEEGGSVVIDVRRRDEWQAGHVKGAIHIPVDDLLSRIDELPRGKKLLFICQAGVRSGLAAEMAAATGFPTEDLYNIEDGMPAWMDAKLPVSYGDDP